MMMADNRPLVAIYAIVRRPRDEVALTLMYNFCVESHWHAIAYIDKSFPKDNAESAWSRLMVDISHGKYYAVVMAWQTPGMAEYCEQYDTHLAVIDPFAMVSSVSWGRKTRVF
jgi:mRNA-degrading endonuclease HigB of HigAB toxin-antitoxin module